MTREARTMAGIILLTVPTIQYGGYFLLSSLTNRNSGYMDNSLRQNFFRAGHAHAGVFVILALACQILADSANLPMGGCGWLEWECLWLRSLFRWDSSSQWRLPPPLHQTP